MTMLKIVYLFASKIICDWVLAFKNHSFFVGLKSDYAKLKSKPELWQEHILENELFENTIADGLDDLSVRSGIISSK